MNAHTQDRHADEVIPSHIADKRRATRHRIDPMVDIIPVPKAVRPTRKMP